MSRGWTTVLWVVVVAATLAITGMNLVRGELNQDEGWYLYAARLVSEGRLPYVDFATTQGPVMPFVYALGQPLVDAFGLAGGRLFTAVLGFATAILAAWLAARTVPREWRNGAALMVFALMGVNVYHSYFTTIAKTYALTGLLLVTAFALLERAAGRRAWLLSGIAGVIVALAAGTRSSAGFAAVAVFAVLAWRAWRAPTAQAPASRQGSCGGGRWTVALSFGIGGALGLALVFGPFLARAAEGVWFALYEYHAGRDAGEVKTLLAYKAGFLARIAQAYPVAVGLAAVGLSGGLFRAQARDDATARESHHTSPMLWGSVVLVTLVHFMAPFPYDDYQVIIYPLLCVAAVQTVCGELAGRGAAAGARGWCALAVVALCCVTALGSPRIQDWFIGKRDRIWWPLKPEASLTQLRRTGKFLAEMCESGDLLLTQDVYLAVETGLRVPHGMELGPFCYYPDWPASKAERLHVLNREQMLRVIGTCEAEAAAFSGYGLALRAPQVAPLTEAEQEELWQAVGERYVPEMEIEGFGQASTTLRLLRRR